MWFDLRTIMVAPHQNACRHAEIATAQPRLTHQEKEPPMFDDNGSFLLALFEFFLFFAWFMCLFWVIGDIFRSKDLSGVAKTFWVFFVIILPWLGILVYLIARGHGMQQRQLEQAQEMNAAQTEYIRSVAGSSGGSSTDQIASAKSLLDSGAITQAEFEALKAKALA
jgi:ABC-type transport system involved in multi-copper enzyme maturation permease subunit